MGIFRRFLSVGVGLAAGAFAYKLLKDYNDNSMLEGDYVEVPMEPEPEKKEAPEQKSEPEVSPYEFVQRPDSGPNVNPVTLGTAEKPLTADGKLDPTKIASPEDFAEWDDLGCRG